MNFRQVKSRIIMILCGSAAIFAGCMLLLIVSDIFLQGLPSLTLSFIITPENLSKTFGDAIANAIIGSIILAILSTLFALPFAISTAIYLQRYAKDTPLTRSVRFMIEVLSGTPSIVLGIFGLLIFVLYLKPFTGGLSLIAASLALAALILPVIERATEDAIIRVPKDLEEGSYALGATKWDTIRGITIPVASSGVITGAILGFGRAAEESAIVIATTGYSQHIPEFKIIPNANYFFGFKIYPLNDLVGTLPVTVYNAYENSNVYPISSGFAAAFVLIMFVLVINISAKSILWYSNNRTSVKKSFANFSFLRWLKRTGSTDKDLPHFHLIVTVPSGIDEPTTDSVVSPKMVRSRRENLPQTPGFGTIVETAIKQVEKKRDSLVNQTMQTSPSGTPVMRFEEKETGQGPPSPAGTPLREYDLYE